MSEFLHPEYLERRRQEDAGILQYGAEQDRMSELPKRDDGALLPEIDDEVLIYEGVLNGGVPPCLQRMISRFTERHGGSITKRPHRHTRDERLGRLERPIVSRRTIKR